MVGKGVPGNLAGSDGDALYTFEVTPNDIGEVTVEIAAGVAEDADGNGNTAAPRFSLGTTYDDDTDNAISKSEAIAAISRLFRWPSYEGADYRYHRALFLPQQLTHLPGNGGEYRDSLLEYTSAAPAELQPPSSARRTACRRRKHGARYFPHFGT